MLSLRDTVYGLYGAYRLARFDSDGLTFLDRSNEGALRSFAAIFLVLPGYFLLILLHAWEQLGQVPLLRLMLLEGLAYAVSWLGFAVVVHMLARLLDRAAYFPGYIAAYNWSNVIQIMVYLPAVAVAESGMLGETWGNAVVAAVTLAVLVYQWFIARVGLAITGLQAVAIVVLDLIVSVFVNAFADKMMWGQ